MTRTYESGVPTSVIEEQRVVQAEKQQGRLLAHYDSLLFPTQNWKMPKSSAVTDFLRPVNVGDTVSLKGVLFGLCDAIPDKPIHWVDMGGGRGLAMRQIAAEIGMPNLINMTNVDLFDYKLDGLKEDEIEYLESLAPGTTSDVAEPELVISDVTSIALEAPADVITSIEVMQYLNDPLAAMCNWYNQLKDGGYMLIATEHDWATWIRYERKETLANEYETPTKHFLDVLESAGIAYAATDEADWPGERRERLKKHDFRILAIQKRAGTKLQLNSEVTRVWTNYEHYKAVYYGEQTNEQPLIKVITD